MWARRKSFGDRTWTGTLLDLSTGAALFGSESVYRDWDTLLEEFNLRVRSNGRGEAQWKFGAVYFNQLVEMPVTESGQSADIVRVSAGTKSDDAQRLECVLVSASAGEGVVSDAISHAVTLRFDSDVESISAGPAADGSWSKVVACRLERGSAPAILHYISISK